MSRPKLCFCRDIKFRPDTMYFKPSGIPINGMKVVELSMEEIEAYRLRHINDLEQQEAARRMSASTSTYQRILDSASKKIADALVFGKAIQITRHIQ